MRHTRFTTRRPLSPLIVLSVLLAALSGCRAAGKSAQGAPARVGSEHIVGTIDLGPGATGGGPVTVEIVVTNAGSLQTVRRMGVVEKWPAEFDVDLDWPNKDGEPLTKFGPPVLTVVARGYVRGEVRLASESKTYTIDQAGVGWPLTLTLNPAAE